MLRWLQWRRVKPHVEVTVTLGGAYLVYFVANAYLASSGPSVAPLHLVGLGRTYGIPDPASSASVDKFDVFGKIPPTNLLSQASSPLCAMACTAHRA